MGRSSGLGRFHHAVDERALLQSGSMVALSVVSIVVADIAKSMDFYSRLGLELSDGAAGEDHAEFAGKGVRVMLDTEALIQKLHEGWTRPTGGHAMALAFQCETPASVDEIHDLLTSTGSISVQEPWDAFWGQRYATVADPDGNPVDLFCPL